MQDKSVHDENIARMVESPHDGLYESDGEVHGDGLVQKPTGWVSRLP